MPFQLQLLLPCPLLSPPCLNKASQTFCNRGHDFSQPPSPLAGMRKQLVWQTRATPTLWLCPYFLLPFSTTHFHFFQDFVAKFTFSLVPLLLPHSWGTQHPWEGSNILTSRVLSYQLLKISYATTNIIWQHGEEIRTTFLNMNFRMR